MTERQISYGRGGAGNIASATQAEQLERKDLETPTIKSDVYTTGRGGSGNMVANDDPKVARIAQDVEAPPSLTSEHEHDRKILLGRGGAANLYSPHEEAEAAANELHRVATASRQAAAQEAADGLRRPSAAHVHHGFHHTDSEDRGS